MAETGAGPIAGAKQGVVLTLGYCSQILSTLSLVPILPKIAEHYAGDASAAPLVPFILSITTLALALVSPFVGFAVDRLGPRRTLNVGIVLFALTGLGAYLAATLPPVLGWRALAGAAQACITVSCSTLVSRYFHGAARQKWLGVQMFGFSVMMVIVGASAGLIGDLDWRLVYLMPSAALLLLPAAIALLPEPAAEERPADAPAAQFPLRTVLGVCGFAFAFSALIYAPALCVGFMLQERGAPSASEAGYFVALTATAAGIASIGFGMTSAMPVQRKLVLSCVALSLCLFAVLAPGRWGVALSMIFAGCTMGFGVATLFAWMMSAAPRALAAARSACCKLRRFSPNS